MKKAMFLTWTCRSGVILLLLQIYCCSCQYAFITWKADKAEITVTDYFADIPDDVVARAVYRNNINKTGWAFLEIVTSPEASDSQQAYAAGYLEGFLSRDLIWMHWQNMLEGFCLNKTDVCSAVEEFVDKNEQYMSDMIRSYPNDPYWYQIKLYYTQIEGVAVGYEEATTNSYEQLTIRDIIWINMLGDLDEIAFSQSMPRVDSEGFLFGHDRCTGIVKLLPDLQDLYTSQVTWNSYQSMLRMQKLYVMHLHTCPDSKTRIPGYKMSFSSYPAFVQSTDDFYIISSGLVVGETTVGNSNRSLFELVSPVGQIMTYARGMIANRLAKSGVEWCEIFKQHNSGTYNNQWYIVDYNKFTPPTDSAPGVVRAGLLWVLEQIPGYIEARDQTGLLLKQSYFASYNIPSFERVFTLNGGHMRVEMFGEWFGHDTNPRAGIIRREQAKVKCLRDMYYMLRFNDFKHDPLSRCTNCDPPYSGCNAIAARSDLNPANGTYPFKYLGHRSHGATDCKVTTAYIRHSYQFVSVAGPTYNIKRGLPPFNWKEFDLGATVNHIGHPDLWMFPPILHRWEWV